MSRLLFVLLLGTGVGAWAQNANPQNSSPSSSSPANTAPSSRTPGAASSQDSKPAKPALPNLAPPRSDHVNADELGDDPGESSSKDTQVDLSPPPDDEKAHPQSADI